jgi:hypothetical protein
MVKILELDGEEKSVAEWAREYGLNTGTLTFRLRRGWSVERAIKTPLHREKSRYKKFVDLTGQIFSRLTVLCKSQKDEYGHITWECLCSCGNRIIARASELKQEHTKSCGCLNTEMAIEWGKRQFVHGGSGTAEYNVWKAMLQRCLDPNCNAYENYGGRSIGVCEQWINSFETFLSDVGKRPSPQHTIDRIDNDGNYEPSNVRWATRKDQARNRRSNRILELDGEKKTVAEWAEQYGLNSNTVYGRLAAGWSAGRAVRTPVDRRFINKRFR